MNKMRYFLLTLLCAVTMSIQAQIEQVHGTVIDDFGTVIGASVCEIDGTGRIIEATVTDINGNFSMKIRNPKNKLRFSYVNYTTQTLPIDREEYEVKLVEKTSLKEVVVKAKKRLNGGGLSIPEREISFATQTISAQEFEGLGINTVDEALQGRIAGLDIVANSGNLGAGTTMRLRGTSSISNITGSNPIVVVNGNTWNANTSDFDFSSANSESFAQLLNVNPEDISQITVLKDAAATAIYGSQGANGVIEITTKRGSRGKPRLSYSLRLTGTYQPKGYDMLSGDDYTMLLKESYFNPMQNDATQNIREINYDKTFSEYHNYNDNTDWVDEVTQFGLRQNHFLSVTGGGEKATFRISGGFDNETGSIIEQRLNRFSTRVALDYYVSDRIKIQTNFSLTYTKNRQNHDDLLKIAYQKMPNMSVYEEDIYGHDTNRYYEMLQSANSVFDKNQKNLVNPVASAKLAKNVDTRYDITPEMVLNYKLLGLDENHWRLDWEARAYMNIFNQYIDKFYPRDLTTGRWDAGNVNSAESASNKSLSFTTKQTLTLVPYFANKDHSLMAMGRMELSTGSNNGQKTVSSGLASGGITSPDEGLYPKPESNFGQWRSLFFTLSTHYSFKSRYSIDFSVRADGTTKFGPSRRWGYFPAVSLRWNIVDEPFMKPFKSWLSMLSIRPSWGRVGTQPRRDYLYESKYGSTDRYMDMSAMTPLNLKLTDLQWETKTTWDLGFDLGLLNDKIRFVLEIYRATTDKMLMENIRIPSNSGYYTLDYMNVGSMRNTGWEFNITTDHLLKSGDFWADFNATFANNKNELLTMNSSVLESLNKDFYYGNREVLQRVQLHNPFGAIYGFRYKGVYQYHYKTVADMDPADQQAFLNSGKTAPIAVNADGAIIYNDEGKPVRMMYNYSNDGTGKNYKFQGGDACYEDINHDGNINALDIVYLGSSLPKLTGGFGFNLNYKRWKLNAQFNYRIGNKILNLARLDAESMISNNNQSQAVNYRWRKEGDGADGQRVIPRAMFGETSNYNTLVSDRFVEKGDFLRLNYLQLSYSFAPAAIKKSLGLNALRFYASANNLFCLTKYSGVDPELGYGGYGVTIDDRQTPRAKSYTLGVTVDF